MNEWFIRVIRNTRLRFGQSPRSFDWRERWHLRLRRPSWAVGGDDLDVVYRDRITIFEKGYVVWAALVQANSLLFSKGSQDSPGVAIYSPDMHWGDPLLPLSEMAEKLGNLKTNSTTAEERVYGAFLADEYARGMRMSIPKSIAGKARVLSTSMIFPRKHMPRATLKNSWFPIVTHPSTGGVMLLPYRYWDPALVENWNSN